MTQNQTVTSKLDIHLGMQNVSITNLVHILIGVNALHNITILKDE